MTKQIQVQVKTVYGKELIYPVCETARKFRDIQGGVILLNRTMKIIKDIGFTVHEIPPERKF